jgi:hypothetical protein
MKSFESPDKNENDDLISLDANSRKYLASLIVKLVQDEDHYLRKLALEDIQDERQDKYGSEESHATARFTLLMLERLLADGQLDMSAVTSPEYLDIPSKDLVIIEEEKLIQCLEAAKERVKKIVSQIKNREFTDLSELIEEKKEEVREDLINLEGVPRHVLDYIYSNYGNPSLSEKHIIYTISSFPEFSAMKQDELKLAAEMFSLVANDVGEVDISSESKLINSKEQLEVIFHGHSLYNELIVSYIAGQVISALKRIISEQERTS